jgi:hypothetical protein
MIDCKIINCEPSLSISCFRKSALNRRTGDKYRFAKASLKKIRNLERIELLLFRMPLESAEKN